MFTDIYLKWPKVFGQQTFLLCKRMHLISGQSSLLQSNSSPAFLSTTPKFGFNIQLPAFKRLLGIITTSFPAAVLSRQTKMLKRIKVASHYERGSLNESGTWTKGWRLTFRRKMYGWETSAAGSKRSLLEQIWEKKKKKKILRTHLQHIREDPWPEPASRLFLFFFPHITSFSRLFSLELGAAGKAEMNQTSLQVSFQVGTFGPCV